MTAPRLLSLLLLLLGMAWAQTGRLEPGDAQLDSGEYVDVHERQGSAGETLTIAYARGDEVRLIDPDGSNDRALWAHGLDDPEEVYGVWNMSWNSDATELAFVSTHENWCSLYQSDVFATGADGAGYRRVTQAPACADHALTQACTKTLC